MNSPATPAARDEPAQIGVVQAMVNIGRAREALCAALHHLHAAMAITPLGEDAVRELALTGERLAAHLHAHRAAIGDMYSGARTIDAMRAKEGGTSGE